MAGMEATERRLQQTEDHWGTVQTNLVDVTAGQQLLQLKLEGHPQWFEWFQRQWSPVGGDIWKGYEVFGKKYVTVCGGFKPHLFALSASYVC